MRESTLRGSVAQGESPSQGVDGACPPEDHERLRVGCLNLDQVSKRASGFVSRLESRGAALAARDYEGPHGADSADSGSRVLDSNGLLCPPSILEAKAGPS